MESPGSYRSAEGALPQRYRDVRMRIVGPVAAPRGEVNGAAGIKSITQYRGDCSKSVSINATAG